jgi:Mrp family chromosome partitioning ATPase
MSAPFATLLNADSGLVPIVLPLPAGPGGDIEPRLDRFAFPALPTTPDQGPATEPHRATWPECSSARTARACSELADSVRRQLPAGRSAVVAFTSPSDDDGRSGLLVSLAPELARRSPGGLLVADGDFHHAELTSRLSISPRQSGGASPLVYATNFPGLSVLPIPAAIRPDGGAAGGAAAGRIAQQPPGGRRAMRAKEGLPIVRLNPAWVDRWRADWPLVLLDAASLQHTDAWPMLERCDGVYLVVCIGSTKRRALRQAVSAFRSHGIALLGCVAMSPAGPENN